MFKKGESGNPGGRPQGAKDKAIANIKQSYQSLIEGNLSNIETWLNEVAAKDPGKAIELTLRLSEFVVPKMKAVEHSGVEGKDLFPPRTLTKEEAKELWGEFENGKFPKLSHV